MASMPLRVAWEQKVAILLLVVVAMADYTCSSQMYLQPSLAMPSPMKNRVGGTCYDKIVFHLP